MTPVRVLLVHADASRVKSLYRSALSGLPNVELRIVYRGAFSGAYVGPKSLTAQFPHALALVQSLFQGFRAGEPLVGIGFSAGCFAYRRWLDEPENRDLFDAVVLLDGLHASLAGGKPDPAALAGVFAYADACVQSGGRRLLVQQNTDIDTEHLQRPYASTTSTAAALLDHLRLAVGSPARPRRDAGHTVGVVVRADPGAGAAAHVHALCEAGPELCRDVVVPHVLALLRARADEVPAQPPPAAPAPSTPPAWTDPALSLAERCVRLCEQERTNGVHANPTGPNTGPLVAKYFAGAMRDGKPLGLGQGNWCMLAQGWVLDQCHLPGDPSPHGWRAGVIEAIADARPVGAYHGVAEARSGAFRPQRGDLAIWNRSQPGKPNTTWWRHVNRITWWNEAGTAAPDDDFFGVIGGNEGNRAWTAPSAPPRRLSDPTLLGFIAYPRFAAAAAEEPAILSTAETPAIEPEEEPPAPAVMPTVEQRGIDVSHHQPKIDFAAVASGGISFVICRATYGTKPDATFPKYTVAAHQAGLELGAYHFLRYKSGQSAADQAQAFLTALTAVESTLGAPIPILAVDIEANPQYDDPLDRAQYVVALRTWLETVTRATARKPLIYVPPSFWLQIGGPVDLAQQHDLWLAHYTTGKPTIPSGWNQYAIWQFTGSGHVPGVVGPVDVDRRWR